MSKNIILLSDGTGNSAKKLFKTNVWRLYQALNLSEPNPATPVGRKQIAYYDDGVGTASFLPLAIFSGAFGWGTKRNVLDLYTFLCRHYEEGDSVYCFGFSRGAFTIRLLTGLIDSQGLVEPKPESELRYLAAEAFRAYREDRYKRIWVKPFRALRNVILGLWHTITGRKIRYEKTEKEPPKIKFLGLWDTVAAYGLPIDELTHAWDFIFPLSFPNRRLSNIVSCAYHAVAIDDERLTFHPELWDEDPSGYDKVPLKNRLTQVWFAGMHSNLGGGYPDDGLSGVPLNWILDKAEQEGVVFWPNERERLRETARVRGKKYDSRQGLGGAYRYLPRKIEALSNYHEGHEDQVTIAVPKIHESVFIRIQNRVDAYAPIALPEKYEVIPANDAHPPGPEHLEKNPTDRANRQEKVWNLVWWKRVIYFITVTLFILLAVLPLYQPEIRHYDGALSAVIGKLGSFLPGFLSPWLESYQRHSLLFLLAVTTLVGSLISASWLQGRIFDNMRSIFDNPRLEPPAIEDSPTDVIYNLRSNATVEKSAKWIKEKFMPWVLLIFIAMFILRAIFAIIDSSGFYNPAPLSSSAENRAFDSRDLLWDTGVEVVKGKNYRITLETTGIGQDMWQDKTIDAPTSGFSRWYLIPAIPLRRHIAEPWFKPIARIGKYGTDDYPLNAVKESESNNNKLVAEIKARNSGELFLFVNDAVLPLPRAWQYFYINNRGTAIVNVEPLNGRDGDSLQMQ